MSNKKKVKKLWKPCPECGSKNTFITSYNSHNIDKNCVITIQDDYMECEDCGYKEKIKKKNHNRDFD